MPGRAYFGLGRENRYQGQFEAPALEEGPNIGRVRVILGLLAGLMVIWIAYAVHHPEFFSDKCTQPHSKCPPPSGGLPMFIWVGIGVLLATIVIAWPYLTFTIKSWRRGSEQE